MDDFLTTEPDPWVDWEGARLRLSQALPMIRREFTTRRVPSHEADVLVSVLLERMWVERAARCRSIPRTAQGSAPDELRIAPGEIRRLAGAQLAAIRRTARCAAVEATTLRGPQVFSQFKGPTGDGLTSDAFVDTRPGPDVMAEDADTRAALREAARREPGQYPSTRRRVKEVLDNAPHSPPPYGRDATRLARMLLRKVYTAIFGAPSGRLAKRDRRWRSG